MKSPSKDKLFIIGDSFGKWPFPEQRHWTDYMKQHYDVKNFAFGGASFAELCFQTTYIEDFKEGDRLIIVVTEPTRFSKYMRIYLGPNTQEGQDIINTIKMGRYEDLEHIRKNKKDMIPRLHKRHKNYQNKAYADLFFIINLQKHYSILKPLYVTWNDYAAKLFDGLVENFLIFRDADYTSLHQEGIIENDHHPGIEGNKVWYRKILSKLVGDPMNSSYI